MTAFFQTDQPIYSAQYVRIRLGYSIMPSKSRSVVNKASQCIPAEEYLWIYESPKFSMEQVYLEVVHMQFAILPFLIFAWGESYKVTVKGYLDSSNFESLSGSFSPGPDFLYCKYRDFSILMKVMFQLLEWLCFFIIVMWRIWTAAKVDKNVVLCTSVSSILFRDVMELRVDLENEQVDSIQVFKLPRPVLCIGGVLQVELLGRVQTQAIDQLYYIW